MAFQGSPVSVTLFSIPAIKGHLHETEAGREPARHTFACCIHAVRLHRRPYRGLQNSIPYITAYVPWWVPLVILCAAPVMRVLPRKGITDADQ